MFGEKIGERCVSFDQIECLTVAPRDVQLLGHFPPICPIVCSLCMKRGKRGQNYLHCMPPVTFGEGQKIQILRKFGATKRQHKLPKLKCVVENLERI